MVGLCTLGLGRSLSFTGSWRMSLILSSALAALLFITVAATLLVYPLGVLPSDAINFTAAGPARTLEALLAGCLLLVGCRYLWPQALQARPEKARLGCALGLGVGAALGGMQALLCASTPYCLAQ